MPEAPLVMVRQSCGVILRVSGSNKIYHPPLRTFSTLSKLTMHSKAASTGYILPLSLKHLGHTHYVFFWHQSMIKAEGANVIGWYITVCKRLRDLSDNPTFIEAERLPSYSRHPPELTRGAGEQKISGELSLCFCVHHQRHISINQRKGEELDTFHVLINTGALFRTAGEKQTYFLTCHLLYLNMHREITAHAHTLKNILNCKF